MKILVIAGYGPSLTNFRGPLLKLMVGAGHEVTACSPNLRASIRDSLEKIGVSSREIPMDRTGVNPGRDLVTLSYLRKVFIEEKPDIVFSYTIKPVIYGSLAAQSARVPQIASMITGLGYTFGSGSTKQFLVGRLTQALYRRALRSNSVVFCQNPDDRQLFIDRRVIDDPNKALVINGSGVDLEHFQKTPVRINPPTFLLIARLLRDKGIREYVEAARLIKDKVSVKRSTPSRGMLRSVSVMGCVDCLR